MLHNTVPSTKRIRCKLILDKDKNKKEDLEQQAKEYNTKTYGHNTENLTSTSSQNPNFKDYKHIRTDRNARVDFCFSLRVLSEEKQTWWSCSCWIATVLLQISHGIISLFSSVLLNLMWKHDSFTYQVIFLQFTNILKSVNRCWSILLHSSYIIYTKMYSKNRSRIEQN